MVVSCTVFKILLHKGRKIAFLPYLPCFEALARGGIPPEFLDETYPAETRGMGLLYGENCIILTSNAFDWSTPVTDRRTDGIAMAYTRYRVYAVARKNNDFSLHRPHDVCRCRLLLEVLDVVWFVCLCLGHSHELCKNDWIYQHTVCSRLTWVQGTTY